MMSKEEIARGRTAFSKFESELKGIWGENFDDMLIHAIREHVVEGRSVNQILADARGQ